MGRANRSAAGISTRTGPSGTFPPMHETLVLAPTADPRVFLADDGRTLCPPTGWVCLPPGDAALTRRVKLAGPSWAVVEKRGRKAFSKGLWAPAAHVDTVRAALEAERATEGYTKKRAADVVRRERAQTEYVAAFEAEVASFLAFSPAWRALGAALAQRVAEHATRVGSGTVARTRRIDIDARAELAVIAWMRHQTTAYDRMEIPRVKGKRREVRSALARVSRAVLDQHRRDAPHAAAGCPLCTALTP